jgi:NADPH2:quinone reductase
MRAVQIAQFGNPDVLDVVDIPTPEPGNNQVRIKVMAAGVNPVDTYVRSGAYGDRPMPVSLGFDAAGEIDAVGPGVDAAVIGTRVYTCTALPGAYAEFAIVDIDRTYPLPDTISFDQGAAIGIPYATAYAALHQHTSTNATSTVFVHGGSGGVGIPTIELAKIAGARVAASCGTDAGEEILRAHGADIIVRHDKDGYLDTLTALVSSPGPAGQVGIDTIVEMAAHINLGNDLTLLNNRGTVVVVGSRGPVQINARDVMRRDARIQGMLLFNLTSEERQEIHSKLYPLLLDGLLSPRVAATLPLDAVRDAHIRVLQSGIGGKIVLNPWTMQYPLELGNQS